MRNRLKRETRQLKKSWMQYDATLLRDYLVEEAEDPRINIQSILTRHFLLEGLFENRFAALKQEELRFAVAVSWLDKFLQKSSCANDLQELLYALDKRADNAAGVEIPHFVSAAYRALPVTADGQAIPNYIRDALLTKPQGRLPLPVRNERKEGHPTADAQARHKQNEPPLPGPLLHREEREKPSVLSSVVQAAVSSVSEAQLETGTSWLLEQRKEMFQRLWRKVLARRRPRRISVLEPACGSANDYRFIEAFGLARLINYNGFDLCETNIKNARSLYPDTRFAVGNVFEIDSRNKAFDYCFVHDLFEHLSIEGMEAAIAEICRVTRKGICASFFNMAEVDEHVVRPVDDYHWNTLSMERTREIFCQHASSVQVVHIGAFLRWSFQCAETYNQGAYTFVITK
jgi:SAM-dependent methyltransferase